MVLSTTLIDDQLVWLSSLSMEGICKSITWINKSSMRNLAMFGLYYIFTMVDVIVQVWATYQS